jgi:murein DD-endopeptidase MepM/ murein hydrolase activator NlpD
MACPPPDAPPSDDCTDLGVWPIAGMTEPERMTDPYGPRLLGGAYDFHRGIDLNEPRGTPVLALLPGTVVRRRTAPLGSTDQRLGKYLVVAHEDAEGNAFQTKYQHLNSMHVREGEDVVCGQTIGTVGDSGVDINTVHLHFALSVGRDDGVFARSGTRNPLHILPYTPGTKFLEIRRTDTELSMVLVQERSSTDVVRWEIAPAGHPLKILDWESREGMDPDDDDSNPWAGITVTPDDFSLGSESYRVTLSYEGDWADLSSCSVTLYDVRGGTYTFDETF